MEEEMRDYIRDIAINLQMLVDMVWAMGGGEALNEEEKTKEKRQKSQEPRQRK